ncbi:hypothetical protein ACJRO7_012353 [Eucalyptus globulus]|uniref:Cytochrome P450 n=1 Tax=Eucalyptus globulus TaxID=34317 RepID=A0ABD3LNU9_EUCGL
MRYNTKGLPLGTLGWLLLGETTAFLKEGPRFTSKKKAKYEFLRTGVYSITCLKLSQVISMDLKLNGYILLNEAKGLSSWFTHNPIWKYLGDPTLPLAFLALVGPAMMKDDDLLRKINKNMRFFTDEGRTLYIRDKTAFSIAFKQILELESDFIFEARREVIDMLKQVTKERRASSARHDDMLYYLMNDEYGNNYRLIQETLSTTSMTALRYLNNHPSAPQEIKKELEEAIHWNDYKSMQFTRAVILESSRLATIVNGLMRKKATDVELNVEPSRPVMESHYYCSLFGGGSRPCPGKEREEVGKSEIHEFPGVEAPNGLHI